MSYKQYLGDDSIHVGLTTHFIIRNNAAPLRSGTAYFFTNVVLLYNVLGMTCGVHGSSSAGMVELGAYWVILDLGRSCLFDRLH